MADKRDEEEELISIVSKIKDDVINHFEETFEKELEAKTIDDLREIDFMPFIGQKGEEAGNEFTKRINKAIPTGVRAPYLSALITTTRGLVVATAKEIAHGKIVEKNTSKPLCPGNIDELKLEQETPYLSQEIKHKLFTPDKREYEVTIMIKDSEERIIIPGVKCTQHRCTGQSGPDKKAVIETWFEPNTQTVMLEDSTVSKIKWNVRGHKSLLRKRRLARPHQITKSFVLQVSSPWKIVSFEKSSDNVVTELVDDGHTLNASSVDGLGNIQNIKLELCY